MFYAERRKFDKYVYMCVCVIGLGYNFSATH